MAPDSPGFGDSLAEGTASAEEGLDIDGVLRFSLWFLEIANRHSKMAPLLRDFLHEIATVAAVEAVGIRILDEHGNIPYEAHQGFKPGFYERESPLSLHSDRCMCINVIKGQTEPSQPFYTRGGSFFMNDTTRFLATVSEEAKGETRNVCNQMGYESVALVPVPLEGRILGLIHLADTRENRVPLALVQLLEGAALQLGTALQRVWMAEELDQHGRQLEELVQKRTAGLFETILRLRKEMGRREESEARFRLLAENAQDIIARYEVVPERRYSYVSPSATRILGYTPEEFYADPEFYLKILHPSEDVRRFESEAKGSLGALAATFRCVSKDGHGVWLELCTKPILDERGQVVAVEGIARDVSERKSMEERLVRAERLEAAGRVAAQVAHDFNNLLGPLAGYPGLMRRMLPAGHLAIRYCDAMEESVHTMIDLGADMLILARGGHPERRVQDLNEIVEQALGLSHGVPTSLRLVVELSESLLPVEASPSQLLRVVTNLITNAREAMLDAGEIVARTENVYLDEPLRRYSLVNRGEYVCLTIKDSGPGIPCAVMDRMFDPFFTTKSGKRRGCGLGLSIVQAVVEQSGGYVDVESKVGSGTSFRIYLPVCRQGTAAKLAGALQRGTGRILVVDDDGCQRELAREILESLSYRVTLAESGEEAVRLCGEGDYDLLLLDVIMPPGIDGVEAYLRAVEKKPGQKAVLMSGCASTDRIGLAQARGAGPYLRKPLTVEGLARAISEALR